MATTVRFVPICSGCAHYFENNGKKCIYRCAKTKLFRGIFESDDDADRYIDDRLTDSEKTCIAYKEFKPKLPLTKENLKKELDKIKTFKGLEVIDDAVRKIQLIEKTDVLKLIDAME